MLYRFMLSRLIEVDKEIVEMLDGMCFMQKLLLFFSEILQEFFFFNMIWSGL